MGRRKLTDAEKNARMIAKISENKEIDKESQLTVFTKSKKILLPEEIIEKYKYEMTPVGELKELGKFVFGCSGNKTYEDAIIEAIRQKEQYNNDKKNTTDKMELINYFAQEHSGKSILVGYKKVPV